MQMVAPLTMMKSPSENLYEYIKRSDDRAALGPLFSYTLDLAPVPAARPRVGKWGTYYPPRYEKWKKEALLLFIATTFKPTSKLVVVFIEVVCTKPRTGKLPTPVGDVDNYAKGPLDAMTKSGRFWEDDKQVVGLTVCKRYCHSDELPHMLIEWNSVS